MPTTPQSSPKPPNAPTARQARAWYMDAVLSLACFAIVVFLGKGVTRIFGPFGGIFFLVIFGGAGYALGKAAWRGLIGDRSSGSPGARR